MKTKWFWLLHASITTLSLSDIASDIFSRSHFEVLSVQRVIMGLNLSDIFLPSLLSVPLCVALLSLQVTSLLLLFCFCQYERRVIYHGGGEGDAPTPHPPLIHPTLFNAHWQRWWGLFFSVRSISLPPSLISGYSVSVLYCQLCIKSSFPLRPEPDQGDPAGAPKPQSDPLLSLSSRSKL